MYEQNHVWMEDDAYLVVRDRDAAEGIVQRIFVKLLRGRVAVEKLTRKYLRRAVRNTCTDALAHERREGEVLALFAGEFGDGNDGTPLAMNETTERWARLLAILPPRPREILLALAQGLSHSEIAAYLGISVKTVETHWQRVKAIARREREREREEVRRGMIWRSPGANPDPVHARRRPGWPRDKKRIVVLAGAAV